MSFVMVRHYQMNVFSFFYACENLHHLGIRDDVKNGDVCYGGVYHYHLDLVSIGGDGDGDDAFPFLPCSQLAPSRSPPVP